MKTVRITGTAGNLVEMPPTPRGVELWNANSPWKYGHHKRALKEWTRWFNLHSREWMQQAYPTGLHWLRRQKRIRPFYTQVYWRDLPGCCKFPRKAVQRLVPIATGPNPYFTCTVAWQIAFAMLEGFERIECWGFSFGTRSEQPLYVAQRPCFFYWVDQARARGIEVWYQPDVSALPHVAGDPLAYTGPLYGFETKPERPRPVRKVRRAA